MPAPSRLQIATSSLERLLKEESSYHKELEQGKARVQRLEGEKSTDDNAEYMIRQEVPKSIPVPGRMLTSLQKKAVQETEAVFPSLHQRIKEAVSQLKQQLVSSMLISIVV
jgi:tubulin-specific chaperone A